MVVASKDEPKPASGGRDMGAESKFEAEQVAQKSNCADLLYFAGRGAYTTRLWRKGRGRDF